MLAFFAAPFAIVLAYSLLTRGVYGGVEQPWTTRRLPAAGRSALSENLAAVLS